MNAKAVSEQLFEAVEAAIAKDWSINRIAEAAGVSRPSLQNWYTGKRAALAMETIDGLCRFFGMTLSRPKISKPPHATEGVREPRRKPQAKKSKPK